MRKQVSAVLKDERTGVQSLAAIALELATQDSEELTLQRVVARAVETIPGCDYAGISIRRGRGVVQTPAATHDVVRCADSLQYELSEGPCLDAIWVDDTYVIDDLETERRWPAWAPRAVDLGLRSVLSVRLATPENVIGGLNLYSRSVSSYDEDTVHLAHAYAAHAAVALAGAMRADGLRTAMQTRHLIGLAQGVLMQRYDLDADRAFGVMRRQSQDSNVKLREIAARIVAQRRNL